MGRLIDRDKRRKAREKRAERKQKILQVANATFSRLPFAEVTLDSIGQAADVDRGVASMYFRTKEELFLLVLREELELWYASVGRALDATEGPMTTEELSGILASSLAERSDLNRFLGFEHVVLEQNIDAMAAFHYQRWRLDQMKELGQSIARLVEGLNDGDGLRLIHRVQLHAAALKPAADPKGAATYEVGDPDFAVFAVDFEEELKATITAVLASWGQGEE